MTQVDGDLTAHILRSHLLLDWFWPAVQSPGIFIGSGLLAASQPSHTGAGAGARAGPLQPVPDQLIPRLASSVRGQAGEAHMLGLEDILDIINKSAG